MCREGRVKKMDGALSEEIQRSLAECPGFLLLQLPPSEGGREPRHLPAGVAHPPWEVTRLPCFLSGSRPHLHWGPEAAILLPTWSLLICSVAKQTLLSPFSR